MLKKLVPEHDDAEDEVRGQSGCGSATHEEICDQALKHYEDLARECCHWNSVVPRAIEFYKKHGVEGDK